MGKIVVLAPLSPSEPDLIESGDLYVELAAAHEGADVVDLMTVALDPDFQRAIEMYQAPVHASGSSTPARADERSGQASRTSARLIAGALAWCRRASSRR